MPNNRRLATEAMANSITLLAVNENKTELLIMDEDGEENLDLAEGVTRLYNRQEIETVLKKHHESILGGQYGVEKTYDQTKGMCGSNGWTCERM